MRATQVFKWPVSSAKADARSSRRKGGLRAARYFKVSAGGRQTRIQVGVMTNAQRQRLQPTAYEKLPAVETSVDIKPRAARSVTPWYHFFLHTRENEESNT